MTSHHWRPYDTPKMISWLISLTCLITLTSALATPLLHYLKLTGLQEIFGLSWFGLKSYLLWQPISYLFVQELPIDGIDIFFLLTLVFNMYVLWMLGSVLHTDIGTKHLLTIYLLTGGLAGLSAIWIEQLTGAYAALYGPTAALLALFTIWAMHYGDSILSLFFLIPLKTKWILTGLLSAITFLSLTRLDLVNFTFYLSAALYAYLYAALVLGLKSPFPILEPIDERLTAWHRWWFNKQFKQSEAKIVDLRGEPVNADDEFIDQMLTKISKYGENSLSMQERQRMQEISDKKRKK